MEVSHFAQGFAVDLLNFRKVKLNEMPEIFVVFGVEGVLFCVTISQTFDTLQKG